MCASSIPDYNFCRKENKWEESSIRTAVVFYIRFSCWRPPRWMSLASLLCVAVRCNSNESPTEWTYNTRTHWTLLLFRQNRKSEIIVGRCTKTKQKRKTGIGRTNPGTVARSLWRVNNTVCPKNWCIWFVCYIRRELHFACHRNHSPSLSIVSAFSRNIGSLGFVRAAFHDSFALIAYIFPLNLSSSISHNALGMNWSKRKLVAGDGTTEMY